MQVITEQKRPKVLVFSRSEKKYLIDHATVDELMQTLGRDLVEERFGSPQIRNLYLDTPDFRLIRRSLERPVYKEKLRVRTYGEITDSDHEAFVEIKKKLEGRVYKRRLALPLGEAEGFVRGKTTYDSQIGRELTWSIQSYRSLLPAISVVYERYAYTYPGRDGNVRITIDCNLMAMRGSWSDFYLPIDASSYQPLLPEGCCIMEIKVRGAIPLVLVEVMSDLGIYPKSFSKVGAAFTRLLSNRSSLLQIEMEGTEDVRVL